MYITYATMYSSIWKYEKLYMVHIILTQLNNKNVEGCKSKHVVCQSNMCLLYGAKPCKRYEPHIAHVMPMRHEPWWNFGAVIVPTLAVSVLSFYILISSYI